MPTCPPQALPSQLGYLERRPDPRDGRAKLIFPTRRGRQALDDAVTTQITRQLPQTRP